MLSAQTTDKTVNQVTPALFARYPDAVALAGADRAELEEILKPTGFFRAKANSVLGLARRSSSGSTARCPAGWPTW